MLVCFLISISVLRTTDHADREGAERAVSTGERVDAASHARQGGAAAVGQARQLQRRQRGERPTHAAAVRVVQRQSLHRVSGEQIM